MSYGNQGLEKIKNTLWYDLLQSKDKVEKREVGNVLVLGDRGCGKKALINSMLKKLKQK